MTQEQIDTQLSASQLSAMFDGELPAAECLLLSRRVDRDEKLRARWSRYALIGAAMRSEPVATACSGFASRVSAALDADLNPSSSSPARAKGASKAGSASRGALSGRGVWNTALAASMVVAVAGVSIAMLRYSSPAGNAAVARVDIAGQVRPGRVQQASASPANYAGATAMPVGVRTAAIAGAGNDEPRSYVTPVNQSSNPTTSRIGLQTQLADYMVAHSEYSSPLMRRSLLSALVSSEEAAEVPVGQIDAMPAAGSATH